MTGRFLRCCLALLGLLMSLAHGGAARAQPAQLLPTTTSTTEAPQTTTTEAPATTTTEAPEEPAAPSTTARPQPGDDEEVSAVAEDATTTTAGSPLLEEGPPVDPAVAAGQATTTTTAPSSDRDDTGRTVTLVVTGLVGLGLVFGLLTYWYWRRTRPIRPTPKQATPAPRGGALR